MTTSFPPTSKQSLYEEAFALLARADALLEGVRERHEAKLATMLTEIDARFLSGNAVAVERASVTAQEWAVIRQYVSASLAARPDDETPAERTDYKGFQWLVVGEYEKDGRANLAQLPEGTKLYMRYTPP